MTNTLPLSTKPRTQLHRLIRPLFFALLVGLIGASGCSSKKPKTKVTGKVLVGKDPALGEIVFVGSDGKEHMFGLGSDGTYNALNVPTGKCQVAVRMPKTAGGGPPVQAGSGGLIAPPKDATSTGGSSLLGGSTAKPAPAPYNDPKTSGLEYEVVSGEQSKDFELDPAKK